VLKYLRDTQATIDIAVRSRAESETDGDDERRPWLSAERIWGEAMTSNNPSLNLIALESEHTAAMAIRAATADGRITLLGIVTDLPTLLSVVTEKRPGVVLLDLAHAGSDVGGDGSHGAIGIAGVVRRRHRFDVTPITISRAVSAGARGFILRPFEPSDLASTIRDAHTNQTELRRLQRGDLTPARNRGR